MPRRCNNSSRLCLQKPCQKEFSCHVPLPRQTQASKSMKKRVSCKCHIHSYATAKKEQRSTYIYVYITLFIAVGDAQFRIGIKGLYWVTRRPRMSAIPILLGIIHHPLGRLLLVEKCIGAWRNHTSHPNDARCIGLRGGKGRVTRHGGEL